MAAAKNEIRKNWREKNWRENAILSQHFNSASNSNSEKKETKLREVEIERERECVITRNREWWRKRERLKRKNERAK